MRSSNVYVLAALLWSGAVVDDVVAVLDGVAGRMGSGGAQICTAGTGFGAYLAAAGALKRPELVKCIVALGGVYDLDQYLQSIKTSFESAILARFAFADLPGAKQAVSAVREPQRLCAPILVAHSRDDCSVPFAQSERLAAALQSKAKAAEVIALERGGAQLNVQSECARFFRAMLAFPSRVTAKPATGGPPA